MKPLTEKMIASGIIDVHVLRLLESWGQLDVGASDKAGDLAKLALADFAEDIEKLLEDANEVRETRLEVDAKREVVVMLPGNASLKGYLDTMDRLVLLVSRNMANLTRGVRVRVSTEDPMTWDTKTVLDIDLIFNQDRVIALLVTVD
jgi:hypothetical protein